MTEPTSPLSRAEIWGVRIVALSLVVATVLVAMSAVLGAPASTLMLPILILAAIAAGAVWRLAEKRYRGD